MLSLAIDNTNTPNRAYEFQAKASEDNGATGEATMRPADSMTGEVSRVDAGRTASATSERMGVTAGETATHSNSRVPSSRANKAGGGSSSLVAGTHSNLQALSMPAELTGEGFPAILQPSPVIAIPLPIADSQADRPLASAGANAASLFYSTWSPWSVCKGSI